MAYCRTSTKSKSYTTYNMHGASGGTYEVPSYASSAPSVPTESDSLLSERDPQIRQVRPKKHRDCLPVVLLAVVVLVMAGAFLAGWFMTHTFKSWKRDRLQHEADQELWESQEREWQKGRAIQERHTAMYNIDRQSWQEERKYIASERSAHHREVMLWDEERQSWEAERVQWRHERDSERKSWMEEQAQWERQKKSERQSWELEKGLEKQSRERERLSDRQSWLAEQGSWERDRRQWDLKRKQWEREERLHPGRCPVVPAGAYWDEPTPVPHCHSYGKREYSARLRNIPSGWSWVDACNATPLMMHGISIQSPDSCEDLGMWGGLIGHWIIGFKEIGCEPSLSNFHDVGCVAQGSKLRRIEAQLHDIQPEDDWKAMCSTAPVTIEGIYYPDPSHCEDRSGHKIAMWDIYDPKC